MPLIRESAELPAPYLPAIPPQPDRHLPVTTYSNLIPPDGRPRLRLREAVAQPRRAAPPPGPGAPAVEFSIYRRLPASCAVGVLIMGIPHRKVGLELCELQLCKLVN